MTVKRFYSTGGGAGQHSVEAGAERPSRLHPLFLASACVRGTLALLVVLVAIYVLKLLGASDLIAWLVLGLTSAGLALVLLDDAFDIEGKVAEQAARAAVFEPDGFGVRAAAVREYADDFLRIKGRIPFGRTRLRQPGDNRPFRVYFPSRRADCRRWCVSALLASLHNALRFVAIGLAVVMSIQLYFLSASWVSP
jgi:hypothetical protein